MKNYFWEQKNDDNPYRGKDGFLSLYRLRPDVSSAVNDIKTNNDIGLFWSLIFRIGDVRRLHNILKKNEINILGDGAALRYEFHDVLSAIKDAGMYDDLVKLMGMIHEYTNFENLLYPKLKTDRRKGTLIKHRKPIFKIKDIVKYLKDNWDEWSFTEKSVILKFMPAIPRTRKSMKEWTKERNAWNYKLIQRFIKEFKMTSREYTKLRSEYTKDTEAVRFSVPRSDKRSITQASPAEFAKWVETLPADSRKRMFNRIVKEGNTWTLRDGTPIINAYREWESKKAAAANELRELQARKQRVSRGQVSRSLIANETFTIEDQIKEIELQDQIKVTYGASSIISNYVDFLSGKISETEANNIFDNIMQSMHSDVVALPVIDTSGSMRGGASFTRHGVRLDSAQVAALYATAFMIKNGAELFFTFNGTVQAIYPGVDMQARNGWYRGSFTETVEPFIVPEDTFLENYKRVYGITSKQSGGGTDFRQLTKYIVQYSKSTGINLTEEYPVIVCFSDGDFNGGYTADHVAREAIQNLREIGWNGLLVLWDIRSAYSGSNNFKDVENVVSITTSDPSAIDSLVEGTLSVNFVDGYAPLIKMANSERYKLIRERVMEKLQVTEKVTA